VTPAQRMRRAALLLSRLADEAQDDPSTRGACPACNGTGRRSDPLLIQCRHCERPITRKSIFYDGHPNNPPVWLHDATGERMCQIDWIRHDPHPVAKPRTEE